MGKRIFEPSGELITAEWLREKADRVETGKSFEWAIFVVEADEGGYTELRVEFPSGSPKCKDELVAFEIQTLADSRGTPEAVGIGLYRYVDDVLAMLEILARGCHGWSGSR